LRSLIRLMGAERVALGSDYPFPLGEAPPGRLIESMEDISLEIRQKLLRDNAADFLAMGR
jgi:aminocarboxymuconate-semialdehyde decarboxylase